MSLVSPLRSMLYAPGSDPHKMRKALAAGADAIIFDLEDAVAGDQKATARLEVAALLDELAGASEVQTSVFVRINALATGARAADLDAAVRPAVAGLKVPKVETREDLVALDAAISRLESQRGMRTGSTVVIPGIESARGLVAANVVAQAPRVQSLSFGAVDFAFDLGAEPDSEAIESIVPLSLIAIASAAAGIDRPIDSAWSNFTDDEGLRRSALRARRLGFQGKAVIHPRQVAIVNEVFDITPEDVARAMEVVAEAERAAREGRGALQVAGALVDAAHVRRARAVLTLHQQRGGTIDHA